MVNITNTTQLSVFSLIKTAITSNATLSTKFNATNIYQFEPNHKSASFKGFPYIWVNLPGTDTQKVVFDNSVKGYPFTIAGFVTLYLTITFLQRLSFCYLPSVLKFCLSFLVLLLVLKLWKVFCLVIWTIL